MASVSLQLLGRPVSAAKRPTRSYESISATASTPRRGSNRRWTSSSTPSTTSSASCWHSDHTEPTLGDPPTSCYSRQAVRRILIDLVLTTSAVFTHHGIVHFLDSGTFLGAVRHGSVIPFDQDADMGIDLAGYEYLKTHRVQLPVGYALHVFDSPLYPRGSRYLQLPVRVVHIESKLYLDVFVYLDSVDATGQRITGPMPSGSFVNCVQCPVIDDVTMAFKVAYDWIYPLQRCRFADYDLNCPRNADRYLRFMFGDDYMTPQEYE
ncbi:hypothetical protein PINS_up023670 [Pythium insidiosum]|nr:hypothetical protein PINS_up023670 [Pythium insidiosum]